MGQIRDLRHLYNGTIDQVREATCVRGTKVIAEPLRNETIRIDLDGELSGISRPPLMSYQNIICESQMGCHVFPSLNQSIFDNQQ